MIQTLLFLSVSMLFGNFFTIRILKKSQKQNLLTKTMLTKIGTTFFCVQTATIIFFFDFPGLIYFEILFIPTVVKVLIEYFYHRRDFQFQSEFPAIASIIILHMKSGMSFRKSIELTASRLKNENRFWLEQILDFVVFSQQKVQLDSRFNKLFTFDLLNKMIKIDQESNRSIEKIEALKNNTQILNEFRRRSGKIKGQVYAQLLVIGGMYLAVGIVVAVMFGFQKNIIIYLTSTLLFATSCVWSFFLGKKIKWSV